MSTSLPFQDAQQNGQHVRLVTTNLPSVPDKDGARWKFLGFVPGTNRGIFEEEAGAGSWERREIVIEPLSLSAVFNLTDLCRLFGWQGGTVHQVMDQLRLGELARACA